MKKQTVFFKIKLFFSRIYYKWLNYRADKQGNVIVKQKTSAITINLDFTNSKPGEVIIVKQL